tara:strand:+ start:2568 stop:3344 length:777 start_codon:yes stop_codon:yes gene_type:complete
MDIKSCYIGPEISPEQFIPEHFFLYLAKGIVNGYDGSKNVTLSAGEYCLVRKNNLARYNKQKENDEFEKVVIMFDEPFLREFKQKYNPIMEAFISDEIFIRLTDNKQVSKFIQSLIPHYIGSGVIDEKFAHAKREELLLILLKIQPVLAGIFFDFGTPHKINLKEFMNQNYKFNVSIERFAFLTGRSLSTFKRDFKATFNESPNRWLIKKRLQEAHFLIDKKNKKSSEIYLDLGFEDLSHFSYSFKKYFGMTPTEVNK